MFEASITELLHLYENASAHAQNGDFDAASMVAEQAQEMWEEIRPTEETDHA